MPTPNEISTQMSQALAISEPDLDTSPGTPIRKILDTVAEAVAEAYADRYLLQYQYDIDSRSGADLDSFVALFGFARLPARRASGTILLQRSTTATQSTVISAGAQFGTSDSTPIVVQAQSTIVFPQSALSITVPVQAVVGGSSGNLAANSVVRILSSIDGVGAVSNPSSLTGGTDAESDSQLRDRFKRTLFRNLAGTEDMYLGVALNDPDVSAASVVGPSERWRERIDVVSGAATSTITLLDRFNYSVTGATNGSPIVITTRNAHSLRPNDIVRISGVGGNTNANGTWRVKTVPSTTTFTIQGLDGVTDRQANAAYTSGGTVSFVTRARMIYTDGYAFGADLDNGDVLTPGVHYTFDTTQIPPSITVLDSATVPDGVYDLSIPYAPWASRNDVPKGYANRVDVWVAGTRSNTASESSIYDGRVVFSATSTDQYSVDRFRRQDGTKPTAGNVFVPLGFTPIISLPATLALGSKTVSSNFWLVKEQGVAYGSQRSLEGIEIASTEVQAGSVNIVSSTNASPIVVTVASHLFEVGQRVVVASHLVNTAANGTWTVSAKTSTTITLQGSTGNGVGGATGTISLYHPSLTSYSFNEVPRSIQAQEEAWRLATTDVLVHQGVNLLTKVYAAVILRPGYSIAGIQTAVNTAVSAYLTSLGFGGTLQVSDLLNVMGDVNGVDAVRLLNGNDMTTFTITGATNANPIVLTTSTNHGFAAGDMLVVDQVAGNTAANGTWIAQSVTNNTVTLRNAVGNAAYTSGGRVFKADFGIKLMEEDGVRAKFNINTGASLYRARDIEADDHEYFTMSAVVLSSKAPNTFGSA
jgi:uncharacterized phage protein gp47/JayE